MFISPSKLNYREVISDESYNRRADIKDYIRHTENRLE